MKRVRFVMLAVILAAMTAGAGAASEQLYDEQADAHKQVDTAIAEASRAGKNLVLIFGANW